MALAAWSEPSDTEAIEVPAGNATVLLALAQEFGRRGWLADAFDAYLLAAKAFADDGLHLRALGAWREAIQIDPRRDDVADLVADASRRLDLPGMLAGFEQFRAACLAQPLPASPPERHIRLVLVRPEPQPVSPSQPGAPPPPFRSRAKRTRARSGDPRARPTWPPAGRELARPEGVGPPSPSGMQEASAVSSLARGAPDGGPEGQATRPRARNPVQKPAPPPATPCTFCDQRAVATIAFRFPRPNPLPGTRRMDLLFYPPMDLPACAHCSRIYRTSGR